MNLNDPKQARRVLAELQKRKERKEKLDFEKLLFGPQRAFVKDPSKKKVACCSRRAGKTHGVAVLLLSIAHQYEWAMVPYITLTRGQGKRNIWGTLQQLNENFQLGIHFNNNELIATLPNKSQIFLCGANDEAEIQRLRGAKYPAAVIDEAQDFKPFLQSLIDDVLEPATMDYDGQIIMTGTPGAGCVGVFYEAVTNANGTGEWSVHRWTVRNNPHMPNAEAWIARKMKKAGWDDQHPTYLREFCGVWVQDRDGLVYRFTDALNIIYEQPIGRDWRYVLGIDPGFVDSTAFVVLGFHPLSPEVYVIESYKKTNLIPSAVAAEVERLRERYHFEKIVCDTGGLGKGYAEEMKQKYQLPIQSAEKRDKLIYVEMMNGDLRSGRMKLLFGTNSHLLDEMRLLQWVKNPKTQKRELPDGKYEDHLCDAMLYAWRECKHHQYERELDAPRVGTREWYQKMEDELLDKEFDKIKGVGQKPWWEV